MEVLDSFEDAVAVCRGKGFFRRDFHEPDGNISRFERHSHFLVTCNECTSRHRTHEMGRFVWLLPRIPEEYLTVIGDFFELVTMNHRTEALARIYWDGTYHLAIPPQRVNKASVITYDGSGQKDGMIKVLEIHSHDVMDAFFSAADDVDEVISGVYGVMGRFCHGEPKQLFRACAGDMFTYIDERQIFTPFGNNTGIPSANDLYAAWLKKVSFG